MLNLDWITSNYIDIIRFLIDAFTLKRQYKNINFYSIHVIFQYGSCYDFLAHLRCRGSKESSHLQSNHTLERYVKARAWLIWSFSKASECRVHRSYCKRFAQSARPGYLAAHIFWCSLISLAALLDSTLWPWGYFWSTLKKLLHPWDCLWSTLGTLFVL